MLPLKGLRTAYLEFCTDLSILLSYLLALLFNRCGPMDVFCALLFQMCLAKFSTVLVIIATTAESLYMAVTVLSILYTIPHLIQQLS